MTYNVFALSGKLNLVIMPPDVMWGLEVLVSLLSLKSFLTARPNGAPSKTCQRVGARLSSW